MPSSSTKQPTLDDVQTYWNAHPLFSHELENLGSAEYFASLDAIKRTDVERFAIDFWQFDHFPDKRVLDVGCGPGWITVQYAKNRAMVDSVDLTPKAVELTKTHLRLNGLTANVQVGNAENLPFPDDSFDLVVSSGVLHHTPNTLGAFAECLRVLKPDGVAKITLYRKGLLHQKAVFRLVRFAMRMVGMKHPGADMSRDAADVDDFIRQYDGADNPIGIGHRNAEWRRLLTQIGFTYHFHEVHFFPSRFMRLGSSMPEAIHHLLDRAFGTMVYFELSK